MPAESIPARSTLFQMQGRFAFLSRSVSEAEYEAIGEAKSREEVTSFLGKMADLIYGTNIEAVRVAIYDMRNGPTDERRLGGFVALKQLMPDTVQRDFDIGPSFCDGMLRLTIGDIFRADVDVPRSACGQFMLAQLGLHEPRALGAEPNTVASAAAQLDGFHLHFVGGENFAPNDGESPEYKQQCLQEFIKTNANARQQNAVLAILNTQWSENLKRAARDEDMKYLHREGTCKREIRFESLASGALLLVTRYSNSVSDSDRKTARQTGTYTDCTLQTAYYIGTQHTLNLGVTFQPTR